jgi:L-fuconolactonase
MATVREDWLKLTSEDVIEPELPICDAHHHLWYQTDSYSIEDFLMDTSGGHDIVRTVFIESWKSFRQGKPQGILPVVETEYIEKIVSQSSQPIDVAAGIVGFADLTLGSVVSRVLEAHIMAGKGRFRGIRYTSAWDASREFKSTRKGLLLDSKFREGFACLQKFGLSFDAWLYHPQLMELADLAKKFPDTTIIVDHIGGLLGIGPYTRNREMVFRQWQQGINALAACPNVFVKLGGLGMEISGLGWREKTTPPGSSELAEVMAPYFLWCIDKFGVNRCMFESNFPVDKRSYSYTVIWNAFKKVIKGFSRNEKNALLLDTAVNAYRLTALRPSNSKKL